MPFQNAIGFFESLGKQPDVFVQDYTEVIIGTQTWMKYNWGNNYIGSKVYNDDELNRSIYGGLYTYHMAIAVDFCPVGWHVPSRAEWITLVNYIGGTNNEINGALKETGYTYWNSPNSDATNSSGFSGRGGGENIPGVYASLKEMGRYWTATDQDGLNAYTYELSHDTLYSIENVEGHTNIYISVRLIKD
jgi:uncharacterized protein (TIGR02145 family)